MGGIQDFEVVSKLGLGAYGSVYKVRTMESAAAWFVVDLNVPLPPTMTQCLPRHKSPPWQAVRRVDGRTVAIKRVKLEGLEQQDLAMTLNEVRSVSR